MHVNQACLPRVEHYFNLSSSDLGFIVLESAMWVVMKEMPYNYITVILCLTLSTIWQWLEEGCGGRI